MCQANSVLFCSQQSRFRFIESFSSTAIGSGDSANEFGFCYTHAHTFHERNIISFSLAIHMQFWNFKTMLICIESKIHWEKKHIDTPHKSRQNCCHSAWRMANKKQQQSQRRWSDRAIISKLSIFVVVALSVRACCNALPNHI